MLVRKRKIPPPGYFVAFDIALTCSGWVVFDRFGVVVEYGYFETSNKDNLQIRLKHIEDNISNILSNYKCNSVVVEDGFVGANRGKSLYLAMARAMVYSCANHYSIPVQSFLPQKWKMSIGLKGNADKESIKRLILMKKLIPEKIGKKNKKTPQDVFDACGIGLSYINSRKGK